VHRRVQYLSLLLVSFSYAAIPMDKDSARGGDLQNNCH